MEDSELHAWLMQLRQGTISIEDALSQFQTSYGSTSAVGISQAQLSATRSDEFERIAELTRLFEQASPQLQLGIGDDAAVLRPTPYPRVLSVDVSVEHVHFERSFGSLAELAARAFSAALSDLAAMAATPVAALCSLIVPPELTNVEFNQLNIGLAFAAAYYACPVVGGNLSSGRELSISTTVVGDQQHPLLLRSNAQPGDLIYVTGPLGAAALGLRLLVRGEPERGPSFVSAWRSPRARVAEGRMLAGHAHAAIDVSDGAVQDLGHVCRASGLSAELHAARIPLLNGFYDLARQLGQDALSLALFGGEDYELIYTLPADAPAGPGTCIGCMLKGPSEVRVFDAHGQRIALSDLGYRHF